MGKADLQIHTAAGDGMANAQELLDFVEAETDLSVIAVTDHDSLKGAEAAYDAWSRGRYSFDLVLGMEVTTLAGHLLALWVERPVPSLRSLPKTLEAIHAQNGIAVIPHPFSWATRSLGKRAIDRVCRIRTDGVYFDGIEVENGTAAGRLGREKAIRLNREHYGLAETGGSDAHFLPAVGSSYTIFPGESSADLKQAILAGTTAGAAGRPVPFRALGVGQILKQQVRGLTVTPKMVLESSVKRAIRRLES